MKPDKNRALIGFNVLEKLVFSKNFFFPSRRIAVRSLKRFKNIFKYYDLRIYLSIMICFGGMN